VYLRPQIHVIPRLQLSVTTHHGGDYLPYEQPGAYKQAIERSEAFITKRALKYTNDVEPPPVVHIVKYETDCESVGAMLCKKAEDLKAAVTVVAKHDKTMAQQFFLGSVSNYCVQHAKQPVVVHH